MTETIKSPRAEGSCLVLPLDATQLDLAQTLDCGQAFRWQRLPDGSFVGVAYGRVLRISLQGDAILLHGAAQADCGLWRQYFDLNRDYAALQQDFAADPVLRQAMDYAPGLRVLRQEPWETLCTFILSANNNIPRIKGIVERLCALLGDRLEEGFYSFPPPQRLVGLTVEELAPLRCGYRARFLLDAAAKVTDGTVPLEELAALPTSEAREALLRISGVGPKVADCILLFGYGRCECFPLDTWMKRVMSVLYPQGLPPALISRGGLAQQYLFHFARSHPELFE